MEEREEYSAVGSWSFLGILILLVVWVIYSGDLGATLKDFFVFLLGGASKITTGYVNLLEVLKTIGPVVTVNLIAATVIAIIIEKIKGEVRYVFDYYKMERGPHGLGFLATVFLEELFARWLFLGVLTRLFHGTIAFYLLLVIGNIIWALLHLTNFTDKKDRSWYMVLPQFIGGFFLAYIFVKYGLIITVLAHYTFNAIAFAGGKEQKVSLRDGLLLIYHGLGSLAVFSIIRAKGLSLNMLLVWLSSEPAPISGFGFWDYALLLAGVTLVVNFLASILFLDQTNGAEVENKNVNTLITLLLGPFIFVFLIYLVSFLVGLVFPSIALKVLIVSVLFVAIAPVSSLSALSRAWLTGLPEYFLLICIVTILNFWVAIGLLFFSMALGWLPTQIKK